MARARIEDLQKDVEISRAESRAIMGGGGECIPPTYINEGDDLACNEENNTAQLQDSELRELIGDIIENNPDRRPNLSGQRSFPNPLPTGGRRG